MNVFIFILYSKIHLFMMYHRLSIEIIICILHEILYNKIDCVSGHLIELRCSTQIVIIVVGYGWYLQVGGGLV